MKDEVTVSNVQVASGALMPIKVTLTRAQVEQALAELNESDFLPGTIVEWSSNTRYLLLGGDLDQLCTTKWMKPPRYVRITDGSSTWTAKLEELKKVGRL